MKSRRLNSKHDACDGIANIGDLPQAILEYILSLLPMKDAIKTSVLSRKWRYLWTSIPKLTFEELSYSSRELFMDYIERVLLLHAHSSIKHFSLKCNVLDDASRVNAWVSNVARCNVEFCEIELSKLCEAFVLSGALFTCGTLRNLHLMIPTLTLPSQIHLPSLRILDLTEVEFPNECLIQQLFSSPALENLYIQHCSWVNLRAISILAPKLKFLTIAEQYWDTSEHCCQVRIGECNLESFYYSGPLSNEYSMCNLSVVKAVITTHQTTVQPEVVHRVYKIMHGICAAQELKLYQMTIQLLELEQGSDSRVICPSSSF